MPFGKLVVVIVTEVLTASVRLPVAVRPRESLTWAVNVQEPAALGQPEIVPELAKLSPAGGLPDLIDQVYGVLPPAALRVWLYTRPTVP
jgi:hypothetical protein